MLLECLFGLVRGRRIAERKSLLFDTLQSAPCRNEDCNCIAPAEQAGAGPDIMLLTNYAKVYVPWHCGQTLLGLQKRTQCRLTHLYYPLEVNCIEN